jgi:hypothetical protein
MKRFLFLLILLLMSCTSLGVRNKQNQAQDKPFSTKTCLEALENSLNKGWKRADVNGWDSRLCFYRNDTLCNQIVNQYQACLKGRKASEILKIFGNSFGFHEETYNGYKIGSVWYWCIPPSIKETSEGMELFFDFRQDTLNYVVYRKLEKWRQ